MSLKESGQSNDLYEKILLFLFEKRDTTDLYNVFDIAEDEKEKTALRIKVKELEKKDFVQVEHQQPYHSFFGSGKAKIIGSSPIARERRIAKYRNELKARITLEGVEYVKTNLSKNQSRSLLQVPSDGLSPITSSSLWQRIKNKAAARAEEIIIAIVVGLIVCFLSFAFGWV